MTTFVPFVGRGIAFPMRISATGGIALVEGHDEIAEAVRLILGTMPGERPMRPDFGCAIHDYAFAPADETTASALGSEVRRALERWEPRIDLTSVAVSVDPEAANVMLIDITYAIRTTNDTRNLVFPFYTIPSEVHA